MQQHVYSHKVCSLSNSRFTDTFFCLELSQVTTSLFLLIKLVRSVSIRRVFLQTSTITNETKRRQFKIYRSPETIQLFYTVKNITPSIFQILCWECGVSSENFLGHFTVHGRVLDGYGIRMGRIKEVQRVPLLESLLPSWSGSIRR